MAKFTEVFSDETKRGHKIPTSEYLALGKFPIIDQGQWQIAGYTDLESGAFTDVPAIIFGDHTRIVKYVDTPFFLGADGVKVLKIKTPNADYKYLFYFLQNAKIPNTGYNRHFKWLKELEVPLPSIDEQRRIAAILDKVTDLINKRRAQLDKLDLLVKSRFVEMFGDPITNPHHFNTILGEDFFKLSNGKPVPEDRRKVTGIPAYGGNGISWYTDDALFMDDTLVIGRVGFQSGNVHLAKGPLWITDNAMYISKFYVDNYDLVFLHALMEHINFTRFQDAGDLKKITQKPFMEMEYLFPPIEVQHKYSRLAISVEKMCATVHSDIEKLETLKLSFMQQYFD